MRILIIFLLVIGLAYSQDIEPSQRKFYLDNNPSNTIFLSSQLDYFKLNKFTLGWMWGDQPKITKSLFMNQKDVNSEEYASEIGDSLILFIRSKHSYDNKEYIFHTHCAYESQAVYGKSLQYDPALYIDPSDPYRLNIRVGDTTNPIFGFLNRRGRVDTINPNYSRLIIDDTSLINKVILSDPWPAKMMYGKLLGDSTINDEYSGGRLYITINLRRYGNDNTSDDTPVLKIKVPYKYVATKKNFSYSLAYAKFDSIPQAHKDSLFLIQNYQNSKIRKLEPYSGTKPTEIIIKRSMLPPDEQDITISGFMIFDEQFQLNNNHKLRSNQDPIADGDSLRIDSLKIEVTYLGGCPLAIRSIRFETINFRRIAFGVWDSLFAKSIQDDLNRFTDPSFSSRGVKPSRFNINNEGSPINWGAERHFRRILGDIVTGSNGPWLPNHYDHYINAADKWFSYSKYPPKMAVPFSKSSKPESEKIIFTKPPDTSVKFTVYNHNAWKTLGFHQGFTVHPNNTPLDVFNSGYESFLASGLQCEDIRDSSLSKYREHYNVNYIENRISPMAYYESRLWRYHVEGMLSGFEFSEKPWFPQMFIQSEIKYEDIYDNSGQKIGQSLLANDPSGNTYITGEIYRLTNWNAIILGAKGLMYDGGFDYDDQVKIIPRMDTLSARVPGYDTLPSIEFLTHNKFDNDFIDTTYNHICPQYGGMINTIYDINTVANYMGTLPSRLYIGKRSVRMEMYKLHQWIRQVEDDLMKLRLQAWYGYGYKLWYKQHPRFSQDSILWSYINPDSIKTRKLFDVDSTGYKTTPPDYESTYDTFCDVTLLADTNDLEMRSSFVLGAQNRRTDPLIYSIDSIAWHIDDEEGSTWYWYKDSSMKFYSTAEFDEFVQKGGNICTVPKNDTIDYGGGRYQYTIYERFRDSTYWQTLFWKRLGCREISLQFKYAKDQAHPEDYSLLKITELGYDNDSLNNQPWRDPKYYHKIDTIIGQDGTLKVRLLPGEGKILKVNVLSPEGELRGHLAYSNQRKMIAYPAEQEHQDSTGTVDTVRYHAVYHKYDNMNAKTMVFYNRSRPMKITDPINVIDWEGEVAISDSLVFVDSLNYIWRDSSYDCSYPSIVVRYDESIDSPKVYIVYTCERTNSTGGENMVSIVESILNANDTVHAGFRIQPANVIALAKGVDMDTWGTPMINASANGNYYAWSDSLKGIVAGWKPPDSLHFETELSKKSITYLPIAAPGSIRALHPSLNSYSKPRFGMDNCALVWMERASNGTDLQFNVHYTRLRIDQDRHILNYVPLGKCDPKSDFFSIYNGNNSSVQLSNVRSNIHMYNNAFPVINRVVANDVLEYNNVYNPQDYVYWTAIDNWQQDTIIYCTAFFNLDTLDNQTNEWLPFCWHNYYLSYIRIPDYRLFHPNVSQGYLSYRQGLGGQLQYLTHENDSLLVLNFVSDRNNANMGSDIWQINHSYHSFFNDYNILMTDLTDYSYAHKLSGKGQYPQLAAMPTVESNHEWNQNRRIFETGNTNPPKIATSVQYFYKKFTDEDFAYPFFGYDDLQENNSMFSVVWLSDRNRNLRYIPIHPLTKSGDIYAPTDTIYSDWFQLKDIRKVYYFTHGKPGNNVQMKIERKSDRKRNMIPTMFRPDRGYTNHQITFVNSGDHDYRLLWYRTDTTTYYVEELIIGSLPGLNEMEWGMDNDRLAKTGVDLNEQVIDLGETEYSDLNDYLSIYPNPAEDKVFVTISKPGSGQCRIEMISTLGQVVHTGSANISSSTEINIQGISPGLYIIRALLPNGEVLQNSFVLSR